MKTKLFLVVFFLVGMVSAQEEFSFQLYFEDAVGNRDTITLGYDPLATDTLSPLYDGINLIDLPTDTSTIDVRISNHKLYSNPNTYQTKKRIIPYKCDTDLSPMVAIEVFTKNWPIQINSYNNDFDDTCRKRSFMTSYHPGGWFDVGSKSSLEIFPIGNSWTTATTNYRSPDGGGGGYKDTGGNEISLFWAVFGKKIPYTSVYEKHLTKDNLQPSPNPFINSFSLPILIEKENIKIHNLQGKKIDFEVNGKEILLDNRTSGIYLLSISTDKEVYTYKIIKD